MVWEASVLHNRNAWKYRGLLHVREEDSHLNVANVLGRRECPVWGRGCWGFHRYPCCCSAIYVTCRLKSRARLTDNLVHVVCPRSIRGFKRLGHLASKVSIRLLAIKNKRCILHGCIRTPNTRLASPPSSPKWPESVGGRSSMTVIMHEECSSVGYKSRILIPLLLVFLVLSTPAFVWSLLWPIHLG